MGSDFRDVDNDGLPDICLAALNHETFPLYRNTGKGGFREITTSAGLTALTDSMAGYSVNIADFDNDGWKDIFVSRGHVQSEAMKDALPIDELNTVFRNPGGPREKWTALTEEAGFAAQPARRHRGAAVGDFNHDGKLDVVVTALGAPAEVWLNDGAGGHHWIELALEGTKSNRDGIGARIRVVAGGAEQFQYVSTAAGYASSSAGPVHFGLGGAARAELIEIRWPSGIVQTLRDVAADRIVRVREQR